MSLMTFEEWMDQTQLDGYLECPVCRADQAWEEAFLGPLGTRVWFRCFCCKTEWSAEEGENVDV